MSTLSTHVLDSVTGSPAAGMKITLLGRREPDGSPGEGPGSPTADSPATPSNGWVERGSGTTDADGRLKNFAGAVLEPGVYRLHFDTGAWFAERRRRSFYPEVVLTFTVEDDGHHHVPLLLAPYAYSTYRGS